MEDELLFQIKIPEGSITSIENLTKASKALREERKKLDLTTAEGQKRAQEINRHLDANTELIKKNSSALEKQRLNIGNYGSALDKVIPGLGGMISGFQGMTKAALTFIATPIGAVIAALGLAVAALTSYFKGSEEGQTKFNKIMNVGAAVVGKFSDLIQYLGGFVFDKLTKGGEKVIGFLNKFVPGFEQATTALSKFLNLDSADALSKLQEREVLLNRELILKREILKADIENLKLRADSTKNQQEQAKLLDEAEKKVNELADAEKKLETLRLNVLLEQAKLSNNLREDNDAIEEQKARLFQLDRERDAALKEIATKQLAISEANKAALRKETEELQKEKELQSEIERQKRLRDHEAALEADALTLEQKAAQAAQIDAIDEATANKKMALAQKSLDVTVKTFNKETEEKKKQAEIQKVVDAAKIEAVSNIFRQSAQLAKEGTILSKVLGIASATVDTYKAANLALASYPPPLGGILAGVNIATGLANVSKITGIAGFADSGLSGTKITSRHGLPVKRSNGDNLLATVKTGEVILNERHQAMLGGDATFRRMGVPGFASSGYTGAISVAAQRSELSNRNLERFAEIIRSQKIVTVIEDINDGQSRVASVEGRAQII